MLAPAHIWFTQCQVLSQKNFNQHSDYPSSGGVKCKMLQKSPCSTCDSRLTFGVHTAYSHASYSGFSWWLDLRPHGTQSATKSSSKSWVSSLQLLIWPFQSLSRMCTPGLDLELAFWGSDIIQHTTPRLRHGVTAAPSLRRLSSASITWFWSPAPQLGPNSHQHLTRP